MSMVIYYQSAFNFQKEKLNILAEMLEISKTGRIFISTLSLQELLSELTIEPGRQSSVNENAGGVWNRSPVWVGSYDPVEQDWHRHSRRDCCGQGNPQVDHQNISRCRQLDMHHCWAALFLFTLKRRCNFFPDLRVCRATGAGSTVAPWRLEAAPGTETSSSTLVGLSLSHWWRH